jgi:hypothetical protein
MFRDHVFVIAVDGSIVSHENFANIVTDIAVLRSLSIKVVLVHGIGQQLVGLAGERNIALSDIQGEGPTDVSTMSLAREASALVSQSVLENLSQAGLRCAITNAVRSTKIGRLKGVDHLYTGKVEKVDAAILKSMLSQDILPLVTPIVCDREGQSLRVNSDHLAMELAVALGASKLIYLHALQRPAGERRRAAQPAGRRPQAPARGQAREARSAHPQQGGAGRQGPRRGRPARPHPRRPRLRLPPHRDLRQGRPRHDGARQRLRPHPPGEEERRN